MIEATVVAEDVPFYALVQRGGFVHDRDILRMWRVLDDEVTEPTWPDGVALRTYEDADASGEGPDRRRVRLGRALRAAVARRVARVHD